MCTTTPAASSSISCIRHPAAYMIPHASCRSMLLCMCGPQLIQDSHTLKGDYKCDNYIFEHPGILIPDTRFWYDRNSIPEVHSQVVQNNNNNNNQARILVFFHIRAYFKESCGFASTKGLFRMDHFPQPGDSGTVFISSRFCCCCCFMEVRLRQNQPRSQKVTNWAVQVQQDETIRRNPTSGSVVIEIIPPVHLV